MDCHDATDNGLKELAVSPDISTNRLLFVDFRDSISWIYIFRAKNRRIFLVFVASEKFFPGSIREFQRFNDALRGLL